MARVVENVVSMLEEKIRTDTASDEEYDLYIEYGKYGAVVFRERKHEDLWQQLVREARNFGSGEGGYFKTG